MQLRNSLIILGVLEDQDIEWFVRVGQTTVLQEADILIDGEPARLGNRAQFTVAECPVDLLASAHGF